MLYDSRILKGVSMIRFKKFFIFLSLVLLSFPLRNLHAVKADNPPAAGKEVVLKAADISPKIFPERVFFRGQSAPEQFRNSGGVPSRIRSVAGKSAPQSCRGSAHRTQCSEPR